MERLPNEIKNKIIKECIINIKNIRLINRYFNNIGDNYLCNINKTLILNFEDISEREDKLKLIINKIPKKHKCIKNKTSFCDNYKYYEKNNIIKR